VPEPVARSQRYMPGLDGLRAVAVLAVVAYHLGFSWAPGGLLGVGVFFTLSGYLITDLLLTRIARQGGDLKGFWLARARRLLPALFVMLAVVVVWVAVIGPRQPPEFGRAVGAAVLYVSNWQLIVAQVSYFARFGPPSPLGHLWSLGVEEQFYILWPLLLLAAARWIPERHRRSGLRPRLAGVALLLACASAVEMALLYRPSLDESRIYFGTDTRAFELLAGAALAAMWPSAKLRADIKPGARRALDGIGLVGLVGIVGLIWRTNEYSAFLYRGGFVLLTVATVLVVAALAHPACRLGRVLGLAPLRWVGVRSYGIYLWHFPIVVLTTPAGARGIDLWRDAAQLAATLSVAALSWRFVEEPIRHGALGRLWRRWRTAPHSFLPKPVHGRALVLFASALAILPLAAFAVADTSKTGAEHPAATHAAREAGPARTQLPTPQRHGAAPSAATRSSATRSAVARSRRHAPVPGGAASPLRSSCRAVIDIGDSTSEGLTSAVYLPDPNQRIDAQYARVGVVTQHFEISGARSIVETYEGEPNAYDVALRWRQDGYRGCWVLALGTNDTANVYVGSTVGRLARIQRMMSVIGSQPVMWVNVKSLVTSGPYAEQNMQLWDQALELACRSYPNMRIFDWASVVEDSWFISDGIHYNTPGYAARSRLIAQALAEAFPASGTHSGCVVG
jgi:peptidoglycan/LPS O-acetylase OafA/YrhL